MTPEEKDTVTFHLIKSPRFESLRVDGVLGSISPNGLSLSFYVERLAIPQRMTHEVLEDGTLGGLITAQGKNGIVREIQTGIILDVESARSLRAQLDKMLTIIEEETTHGIH